MTDEIDLVEWFESYDSEYWFKLSQDKDFTYPKERSLLYSLGKLATKGGTPSRKQLDWAKKIVERVEDTRKIKASIKSQSKKGTAAMNFLETRHLTVRMAWHDNNWDGFICADPEKNDYCVGEYSLLSSRIRHRRELEKEKAFSCPRKLGDKDELKGYIPPCYWSINAFGTFSLNVEHIYPLLENPYLTNTPNVPEKLPPYSVFTWPFKLSFVRDKNLESIDGRYPKNLEARIDRFFDKFKKDESIVFFYCNYDNPISGEEQKYLIVGCALFKERGEKHHFDIPKEGLDKMRQVKGYQNFPTIGWEIRITIDEATLIKLPYGEYLEDAQKSDNYELLDEIKVTVDEAELVRSFKYVAMDIDDDHAIYLLTKIKRSLLRIKDHGRFTNEYDVDGNLERLENLLQMAWQKRGMFPGFSSLVRALIGRIDERQRYRIDNLIEDLRKNSGEEYYDTLYNLLESPESVAEFNKKYGGEIAELKEALDIKKISTESFLKLCMLNLYPNQFKRIINGQIGEIKRSVNEICDNPYLLCEEYDFKEGIQDEDLVTGERIDGPIDLLKIDIAYFPDIRYLKKYGKLQRLRPSDPQRLRALVIFYLKSLEGAGDCFDNAAKIEEHLHNYPLFYKTDYLLPENVLTKPAERDKKHFLEKLVIVNDEGRSFYYLKDIYNAERYIEEKIKEILDMPDLKIKASLEIGDSLKKLKRVLKNSFNEEEFKRERRKLYSNILKKRFYVLSGSPGSGKSYELLKIVNELQNSREKCLILAPTGKAVLRLKLNDEGFENIEAQTIDKFLWSQKNKPLGTYEVENLIIDEMSMVDLIKFYDLLRTIRFSSGKFKRMILVGDENQLPPIGFGKVFIDIIRYLRCQQKYSDNYIYLSVNCRQKLDQKIVAFSKIFAGYNKHYEPLLKEVMNEGQISSGLHVYFWRDRRELREKIKNRFCELFKDQAEGNDLNLALNRIFNLRDNGYVNNEDFGFSKELRIDNFQIITPYRTTYYGALGLNNYVQSEFRGNQERVRGIEFPFRHSDKIIQVQNLYDKNGDLQLSNGSIGVVVRRRKANQPDYYFQELDRPIHRSELDAEELELAYAITVHKAQGSGFEHVFFVFPERKGLLTRELVYTALTRSKQGISVFVYGDPNIQAGRSLFDEAMLRSSVELRKTSLLEQPYWEYTLSPAKGVNVKSRVEYIIYKKLMEFQKNVGGFTFQYEEIYKPRKRDFEIKPDFTIELSNQRKIYWEHLGKLNDPTYRKSWQERLEIYKEEELLNDLITTDERKGISDSKIDDVILAIVTGDVKSETKDKLYSNHHYYLA